MLNRQRLADCSFLTHLHWRSSRDEYARDQDDKGCRLLGDHLAGKTLDDSLGIGEFDYLGRLEFAYFSGKSYGLVDNLLLYVRRRFGLLN